MRVFGTWRFEPRSSIGLGAESGTAFFEASSVLSASFCITPDSAGSIVGVNVQPRIPFVWRTTLVTGLSNALSDPYCPGGDLSVNRQGAGYCLACGGVGFVVALLEYTNLESGCCCPHCEAGRRLNESIADMVTRARAEDRLARFLTTPLFRKEHDAQRCAKAASAE